MKQILTIFLFIGLFNFLNAQESVDNPKAPILEFENTTHNFGTIVQDSEAICTFRFTNVGKEALVIENVRSSCGCTVPSWPKEPVKKKKTGEIVVKYDTRIPKTFTKSITVYSNAKNSPVRLTITGVVEPEKENAKSKANIQKIPMDKLPPKK